jgi:hypothetical protein
LLGLLEFQSGNEGEVSRSYDEKDSREMVEMVLLVAREMDLLVAMVRIHFVFLAYAHVFARF